MAKRPKAFRYRPAGRSTKDRAYLLRHGASDARKIRSSRAWAETRDLVRCRFPVCCDPLGRHEQAGEVAATEEVHHIAPLAKRPDLAHEPTNLAPLCVACHATIEAMERRGEATGHLFEGFRKEVERFG